MPGESGAGMSLEVSKIVLNLETNFQQVLKQQINSFDKFTRDANQLTRQVGTNMNQLARTVSKTFSAVYKGNRKEIQEFVSFTRNALQGVRKETLAIQGLQQKFERGTIARYKRMRAELGKIKGKSDVVGQSQKMPAELKGKLMAMYAKQSEAVTTQYKKDITRMQELTDSLLVKHMAKAVKESMQTIEKGSRSAAVTVNNVVNDMQKKFNQLYSQRGLRGQAGFAEEGTKFLKQREQQIKALESLLTAHQKKQVQAERHLEDQKRLLSLQTNKTLINQQQQYVNEARKTVNKLTSEYEFMFNQIQKFARGQTAISGLFKRDAEKGIAEIKKTIGGFRLDREFEKQWKNLEQVARLAGQKTGKAFYEAVDKGRALDAALIEKRKHLEDLLKTAQRLHATGLVDASKQIADLKKTIGGIKEFKTEISKVRKELLSIPKVSFQQFYKGGAQQAKSLAVEIRKAINQLKAMGPVTEENMLRVQTRLKAIENYYKQYAVKRKQAQDTITKLTQIAHQARIRSANAANAQVAAGWKAYERQVTAIITRLQKKLRQAVLPRKPFDDYKRDTLAILNKIRADAETALMPTKNIKAQTAMVLEEYKRIGQEMDRLSRKKMIRPEHIAEGRAFVNKLKVSIKSYNQEILNLNKQLDRLRRAQKNAFSSGVDAQISKTRGRIQELKQTVREYERAQVQMQRRMNTAHRQSLKSVVQNSWEMVRNFRWQVAAVIYLVTRAVWFVNRTIIRLLDQISEYRKSAMSIAAAIAFQMTGSIEESFDKAYAYSRKLMNQLEMVAAETILSLEDMLMLTKTLTQAGIVPKTEEDVRRIAAIGTAIKALTEGMANAGVQMRQELYAVIQGRQRVTDQLAKMFQVMGINITKMIEDGKKEGKSLIETLSTALKPFSEMNKRMVNEWEQVKNRINVVWKMIVRLGGETFLVSWAKELNMLLDNFVKKGEDGFYELTRLAIDWAANINVALNTFKIVFDIVGAIADVISSILGLVGEIVGSIIGLSHEIAGVARNSKGIKGEWDGIIFITRVFLQTLNVVAAILTLIAGIVRSVTVSIGLWVKAAKSFYGFMQAIKKGQFKQAGEIQDEFVAAMRKADKNIKSIWFGEDGWIRKTHKSIDGINRQMDELRDRAAGVKKELADLPELFKLPHDPMIIAERIAKLAPKIKELRLAALEGPAKFKLQKEFALLDVDDLKTKTTEQLAALNKVINAAINKELKLDPDKLTFYVSLRKGAIDALKDLNMLSKAALDKEAKQLRDWNEARRKEMAGWIKGYDSFWNKLTPGDLTREEKTKRWLADMNAQLEELRVKNPLVAKEFEKFGKQLEVALGQRRKDDLEAINKEMEKMKLSLTSHRPLDAISKINAEFDKMKLSIVTNKDFIERGLVPEMEKLFEVTRRERIELEKMSMTYKANTAALDVMSKRAAFLANSYSPAAQLKGQMMQIKIDYQKEFITIQKEIDKTYAAWVENGQWATREGSAEAQRYVKALQDQMEELTRVTERELKKKQYPIWNDMVDASNQWADGFTDALSQIVDGVDSVSEALNQLQKQILKDALKIVIKRTVTDNLQSMLGEEGALFGFKGLFGGGGKEKKGGAQEVTATKPLPVTIYNPQDLMEGTKGIMDKFNMSGQQPIEGTKGIMDKFNMSGQQPIPVYVTNLGGGQMGAAGGLSGAVLDVNQRPMTEEEIAANSLSESSVALAGTSAEIAENTEAANQSNKAWYSGMVDVMASMGDWFKGLFGGGGASVKGTAADTGGVLMAMASTYGRAYGGGGYGFAGGGVINEPIVGKGLKSGEVYNFGENTKYGENEIVAPMKKLQKSVPQNRHEYHMPIHLSAIDTQSGVQFLTKHSDVIQGQMVKGLKQNRPVRRGIQNAY